MRLKGVKSGSKSKLGRIIAKSTTRQRWLAAAFLVVFLAGIIIPLVLSHQKAYAWWNTGWLNRKTITINTSGFSTVTNFPIRVSLDGTKITYGLTKAGGADLRFVDSNDTTALSYQIEKWDTSGTSEVWVKIPSLTGGGTYTIYMYYNNSAATDGQSVNAVWDTNFRGVWHLNQSGTGTAGEYADSTSNANNGQGGGGTSSAAPTQSTGQIGFGGTFDNIDDYILVPYSSSVGITTDITISAWAKRVTSAGGADLDPVLTKGDTNQTVDYELSYCHIYNECASPYNNSLDFASNVTTPMGVASTGQITDTNSWHHIVATRSGSTVSFYIDGTFDSSATMTGSFSDNTGYDLLIGADDLGTSFGYFNGRMDEVRLSNSSRSASWIKAEYLTGTNTINTFGAEESLGPDIPVLTSVSSPSSLMPTFQLRASDSSGAGYARYKIDVCSTSNCSSVVRTIDQTSSQTGWTGQNQQTSTAYTIGTTIGASTLASHTYQAPALNPGTQYWWRGYVINPGTNNAFTAASAIGTFTTDAAPDAPTLSGPADAAVITTGNGPTFQLRGSDSNGGYARYRIQVCSTSNCSSVIRTIDQTASQTGWSGQDQQTSTAYTLATSAASSTMATHVYQAPALTSGTTYYWRGYTIDPGGSNTWSASSAIRSFVYQTNTAPAAPTLISPSNAQAGVNINPLLQVRTTDANSDNLQYRIQVCATSNCSSVLQTIDQTSSQTGWSGQDAQSGAAYVGSSILTSSTIANYVWQLTSLTNSTTYYWRAYAIDPNGTNTWSSASTIQSFTTAAAGTSQKNINGGVKIQGGTRIGN